MSLLLYYIIEEKAILKRKLNRKEAQEMTAIESAILSVTECAKILKISRGSAYQAVLTGELPHVKIGRRILIPRIALERMLDEAKPNKD